MSNLKVTNITADKWMNSDGTENFKCRAWLSLNGTGTISVLGSGNVTSVTDNGTGDYTLSFAKAMPTANYAVSYGCSDALKGGALAKTISSGTNTAVPDIKTTGQLRFGFGSASAAYDTTEISLMVVC